MGKERSISRDGEKVYLDSENDGWSYVNRGPEAHRTEIISADENGLRLVDGSSVGSSSGHLEKEAMRYFAEIANESQPTLPILNDGGPAPEVAPEDASRSDSEEASRETFFIDEAVNKVNTK